MIMAPSNKPSGLVFLDTFSFLGPPDFGQSCHVCSCTMKMWVDSYRVLCIVGWANGSRVLKLSYSGEFMQYKIINVQSHQWRDSRHTLLGVLS